ncbi:tetratricopeptide repeat protein [Streptomyces cyaneofuscatus]|uniref:tetratricopeptide repeat protein n=1 Tax=Streptomyces cyaneofuscatus TaxID=66883 RepID=UPI0036A9EFA3
MEEIAELLGGLGVSSGVVGGGNPSWATFDDALTAWSEGWRETGAAKPAIIVWSGHGVLVDDELRLALSDLDLNVEQVIRDARALKRGVPAERLINDAVASGADQILVIIDTCYAGDAVGRGLEKALRRWETMSTPPDQVKWFGIMASCRRTEPSDGSGPLLAALTEVLRDGPVTTEYRSAWSAHNELISGQDLLAALGERWRGEGQTPVPASVGTGRPVFPNPRHVPGAPARLVEHLVLAARGVGYREEGWFFTGRKEVLGRIVAWLESDEPGLFLVTGPAGCGKSAVLGRIATLTDPVQRRETEAHGGLREDDPDPGLRPDRSLAAVHLRGLSPLQAASDLARQLRLPEPRNADDFRSELRELSPRPVLILDGLDEVPAEHLRAMIEELVFPLSRTNSVLLGSRDRAFRSRLAEVEREYETLPDALARLIGTGVSTADLEKEPHTQNDIGEYVFRRCAAADVLEDRAREAGDAVAARATAVGGGFLFARLVTGSILRGGAADEDQWPAGLPDSIEAAFDEDLRAGAVRVRADGTELPSAARDLLTALAWTVGRGMPAGDIWETVASALNGGGVEYDDGDVDWVLSTYGRFIVEDSEGGQAVYRLYHRELVSHLAGRKGPEGGKASEVVLRALIAHVKRQAVGEGWGTIDPYVVRGLARHAARSEAPGIEMLRELGREQVEASPHLAKALHSYSEQLGREGDLDGGLSAAQESHAIWVRLDQASPGLYQAAVALALSNIAVRRAAAGDRTGALSPAREAVRIQRALADSGAAPLSALAESLSNLGNRIAGIGDHEGALPPAQEAADIYRALAIRNSESFRPDLARMLTNLAAHLGASGQYSAALPCAREAVGVYRDLAALNPGENLKNLPAALTNLSNILSFTGSHTDALLHAEEAAQIHRDAAERHPGAFLPDLAGALNNLSARQAKIGNHKASLASAREAVHIYRDLSSRHPIAFLSDLAGALSNLSYQISSAGDHEGALAPARESVEAFAVLSEQQPEAFRRELAQSLSTLARSTAEARNPVNALPYAHEAVRLQREVTKDHQHASLRDLADFLLNLSKHLILAGEYAASLPPIEEAVEIYRQLSHQDINTFLSGLVSALNNLGAHCANVGDLPRALDLTREALDLQRDLVSRERSTHLPNLAEILNNLAGQLNRIEDPSAGRLAAAEAVTIYRVLAARAPHFRPGLATSLDILAQNLSDTGSPEEASQLAQEAARLWREVVAEQGHTSLPDLAISLENLTTHLEVIGDHEGMASAAKEAVALRRAMAMENPSAYAVSLLSTFTRMAATLAKIGHYELAIGEYDAIVEEFASSQPEFSRRLAIERSIFLLSCPAPWPEDGLNELVVFHVTNFSQVSKSASAITVRARQALRAYSDPSAARAAWEKSTSTPAPDWLVLPPNTLEILTSWVKAPTWANSQEIWSQDVDTLSSSEAEVALEELSLLDPQDAHRHIALRRAILNHGVAAAYDPLILGEQWTEWVECSNWTESQRFLEAHPRLLDVRPPESDLSAHLAILAIARTKGVDAAYRLVKDRNALQAFIGQALEAGDGPALLFAAIIEGQVYGDTLSSLTHSEAGKALAGVAGHTAPADLSAIAAAPLEIRTRLLMEIATLNARHPHPHGELWAKMIQALAGAG